MSREIKFRGKSIKNKKWLYGYLGESKIRIMNTVYTNKVIYDNVISFNTDNYSFVVDDLSVIEETISQFTGLKDVFKKEIYENDIVKVPLLDPIFGDIIKDSFCNSVVKFNKGSFVITYYNNINIYIQDLQDKIEVIGNIFDNPELLED